MSLDVHDLLVDQLVDLLHVLKHGVSLFVENVELALILSQLLLLFKDFGSRVSSLELASPLIIFKLFIDVSHWCVRVVLRVDVRILRLLIVTLDSFSSLLTARLSKLFDVS